jgi:hypothetical protein
MGFQLHVSNLLAIRKVMSAMAVVVTSRRRFDHFLSTTFLSIHTGQVGSLSNRSRNAWLKQ